MSESTFSVNVSPGRTPQVTVRGDNFTEFVTNLADLSHDPDFAEALAAFCEQVNVGYAAASLTQPSGSVSASQPVAKAAAAVGAPSMFTHKDGKGATWTFEHPSAPPLPDGRPYKYAMREGVSEKTNKPYKMLCDPAQCYPQPNEFQFVKGSSEVKPIWKHDLLS